MSIYEVVDAPGQVFTVKVTAKIGTRTVIFNNHTTFIVHKPGQSIWNGPGIGINPPLFTVKGTLIPPDINLIEYKYINLYALFATARWSTSLPYNDDPANSQFSYVQLVNVLYLRNGNAGESTALNTHGKYLLESISIPP
jgi:hypothetical protein